MVLGTFSLRASQPLELLSLLVEAAAAAVRSNGAIRDNMAVLERMIRDCLIVSKECDERSSTFLAISHGKVYAEIAT